VPILPALQPIIDAANAAAPLPDSVPVAERRAHAHEMMEMTFLALTEPGPDVASIVNHTVAVAGGEITVRVYTPLGAGPFPAHLYLHGGGFWLGHPHHFDNGSQALAAGAECVVASVDYRLAPEFKFPTAPEDCYAALLWLVENAGALNVDATRISVGGGSAGGNLTAVVSLMARDRGGPPLVFQVLEIPVVDLTMSFPSINENGTGYILTKEGMESYRGYYVRDEADKKDPYASPIFADDLSGLPPALVMTAEFDPLRDEGIVYALRMLEAGVSVELHSFPGTFHGSGALPTAAVSKRGNRELMVALSRGLRIS